jgi:hypothetical protein
LTGSKHLAQLFLDRVWLTGSSRGSWKSYGSMFPDNNLPRLSRLVGYIRIHPYLMFLTVPCPGNAYQCSNNCKDEQPINLATLESGSSYVRTISRKYFLCARPSRWANKTTLYTACKFVEYLATGTFPSDNTGKQSLESS